VKTIHKLYIIQLIGWLVAVDAIGSIALPGNNHELLYDLERVFRMIGAFIIIYLSADVVDIIDLYIHPDRS
jgi:hypothetical protein